MSTSTGDVAASMENMTISISSKARAEQALEHIYRDFQNKAPQFRANPEGRYVPSVNWSEEMLCRAGNFRTALGASMEATLIFVAILSTSETFMQVFSLPATDDLWATLFTLLCENKASIEFYARSRGVPWARTLRDFVSVIYPEPPYPFNLDSLLGANVDTSNLTPNGISDRILHRNLTDYGPDTFYLSMAGQIFPIEAPTYNEEQPKGLQIVDVKECTYDPEHFQKCKSPPTWPWLEWPRHPQLCQTSFTRSWRGESEPITCKQCNIPFSNEYQWGIPNLGCQCNNWCADALVQVVEYPPFSTEPGVLNRGVRALQVFEANTVIGEYTGQLVPLTEDINKEFLDLAYLFEIKEIGSRSEIASVSARLYGNWTRFVNHCDDEDRVNIKFKSMQVKNRSRVVVVTTRRIAFGEEILGHYGPDYFQTQQNGQAKLLQDMETVVQGLGQL